MTRMQGLGGLVALAGAAQLVVMSVPANPLAHRVRHVGSGQTYATIQSCEDAANPGDVCEVHDGTYAEVVTVSVPRITFRNHDGASPVLQGRFALNSTANVSVQCNRGGGQMSITAWGTSASGVGAIQQFQGSGLLVQGCEIHNGYGPAIYSRDSTKITIVDNVIHDALVADAGLTATGINIVSGRSTDGTYTNGVLIARNEIYKCGVDGISLHGQYHTVIDNYIHDNISTAWESIHPDGIQIIGTSVDGFASAQHVRIVNNVIKNHTQGIFTDGLGQNQSSDCEDIWIVNNVIYQDAGTVNGVNLGTVNASLIVVLDSKTVHIYNNTLGRTTLYGIYTTGNFDGSVYIKNNILKNDSANGVYIEHVNDIAEMDYNVLDTANSLIKWGSTDYNTLAAFRLAVPAFESHGQEANPLIAAMPTPTLQTLSPAIDAGVDLSGVCADCATDKAGIARPQGVAWDVGAYERVQ